MFGAHSGYVSRLNNGTPHVATASRVARKPITEVPIPAFTCSDDQTPEIRFMLFSYSSDCFLVTKPFCACCTHHVQDADVSVAEHNGVGGVGHREKEGEGCGQRGGDQDVQRVDVNGLRLQKQTNSSTV